MLVIKTILVFLLLCPPVYAGQLLITGSPVTVSSGSQPAAYFGNNNTSVVFDSAGAGHLAVWNYSTVACPGTGTRTIDALEAYARSTGSGGNIWMALYSSDGSTIITQYQAAVSVTSGTAGWVGSTATLTGSPQCTGGTSYKLFVYTEGGTPHAEFGYTSPGGTNVYYKSGTDYSGGLPEPLPTPTGADAIYYCIRAHVTAE